MTATIKLRSSAFTQGSPIPEKYTCDGDDVSPPLAWDAAPAGTQSLALICDDPDAPGGTWVHWVLYGLPPGTKALDEGGYAEGAVEGINDFHRTGYGGPCPPPGGAHRYFFRIYALDCALDLPAGATKKKLLAAMQGHVLAQGELMGRYKRK